MDPCEGPEGVPLIIKARVAKSKHHYANNDSLFDRTCRGVCLDRVALSIIFIDKIDPYIMLMLMSSPFLLDILKRCYFIIFVIQTVTLSQERTKAGV